MINNQTMPPLPPPSLPDSPYQLINSGDCNIMLAALLSLLLVVLFVLLLNVYAKWFLSQSLRTNPSSTSSDVSLPNLLGSRFHRFHNYTTNTPPRLHPHSNSDSPIKGLELSVVSSIPLFTHKSDDKSVLECVVCLSAFEDGEVGRKLRNCSHRFHVDCIDMWLYSHSTCPICRESVISEGKLEAIDNEVGELSEIRVENVVASDSLPSDSSSSSSSSSSLALSITRMVSKNRVELSVHPSSNVTD